MISSKSFDRVCCVLPPVHQGTERRTSLSLRSSRGVVIGPFKRKTEIPRGLRAKGQS